MEAEHKTSKCTVELNTCSLHISNKDINEGVNLYFCKFTFFFLSSLGNFH